MRNRIFASLAVLAALLVATLAAAQTPPGVIRCAPMHGPPGTHLVIVGTSLGAGTGVYLNGDGYALRVLHRSRRRMVVEIPADAESGSILVANGDDEDSCGEFVVEQ